MSLSCPKCGVKIKAFKVGNLFSCAVCNSKLKSNITTPAIGAAVVSAFFELLLHALGTTWFAVTLRLLISCCIFLGMYVVFIKKFSKIELRGNHAVKP